MSGPGSVDASLQALGGLSRYQLLQLLVINLGIFGATFQLFDNIFIGEFRSTLTGWLARFLTRVKTR